MHVILHANALYSFLRVIFPPLNDDRREERECRHACACKHTSEERRLPLQGAVTSMYCPCVRH